MPPLRHLALALAAVTAALGAPFAQGLAPAAPPLMDRAGFVRVTGAHFSVDGRPFRFVGANAAILHGAVRRASAEAALDAIAADGLRVVRVWALGEHPAGADAWARDYAFRIGPDAWVESSFVHLDRVLAAARARGLRVIVVLANRWADYGGAPRYLAWSGSLPQHDGAALSEAGLARFFADPAAASLYRQHVARVVGRVNTVTGVAYRDDPTVFAWELINESEASRSGREGLVAWTRDMARYVRSIDPEHLVAAGHIGYSRREQRETWLALQRLPEIGYADAHAYPTHYDVVRTPEELDDFIDDHAQLARYVAGKPMVWGELGFTTAARTHRGHPRAWWFDRFLARAERDGADGVLAWTYCTSADPPRDHGILFGARAARTRDVRAVYARYAARWRDTAATADNPRLIAAQGEAPLWNTRRHREGPGRAGAAPTVRAGAVRWTIQPERFAWVESEAAGRWDGYALRQVYARGPSAVAWALRVTPAARAAMAHATRLRVRLRASSELPGRGEGATAADGSVARVSVDGVVLGEAPLVADDGLGAWVEVASGAGEVLEAVRAVGVHTLRVEVFGENGVCVYGAPTGREPVPASAGELGGVEVSVE